MILSCSPPQSVLHTAASDIENKPGPIPLLLKTPKGSQHTQSKPQSPSRVPQPVQEHLGSQHPHAPSLHSRNAGHCCSSNMQIMLLPQGLCVGCLLCLVCSAPDICMARSLNSFKTLLKVTLLERLPLKTPCHSLHPYPAPFLSTLDKY